MEQLLERFDDEARDSVSLAIAEARRLGHRHVGTEHLLLGLLAKRDSSAARALRNSGATLSGCREKTAELVGRAEPAGRPQGGQPSGEELPGEQLRPTQRAVRTLERAGRLALRRRSDQVRAEHLLISVVEVEGRAGQVLRGLGVDPALLARMIRGQDDAVGETRSSGAAGATPEAPVDAAHEPSPRGRSPRCSSCDAPLEQTLEQRLLRSVSKEDASRPVLVFFCGNCGVTIGVTQFP
jgi:ATP-dependent Clp protease ATP-binding subunit ClpA